MKRIKNFWENDWARIPFSVIGVFLLIGSSMTTVYIAQLEQQKAKEIAWTIQTDTLEPLVQYVEADLARCLNYAACQAFEKVGKNPVVNPVHDTLLWTDITNDGEITRVDVNLNRVRFEAFRNLTQMIAQNFQNNRYIQGEYNVTVTMSESWDDIVLEDSRIVLEMTRQFDNFLKPCESSYWVYPIFGLNMTVSVYDIVKQKTVFEKNSSIATIITNRYLLLENLTDEFDNRLDGTFGSLGLNCLFAAMGLTWVRGWTQHFYNKPLNIVSAHWLEVISNSAILFEEGFVFNSVDPLGVVYTGYETIMAIAEDLGKTTTSDEKKTYLKQQVDTPLGTKDMQARYEQGVTDLGGEVATPEQQQAEVEANITEICQDAADWLFGDPDGVKTMAVLNGSSADVYTQVKRDTFWHNQDSVDAEIQAAYEDPAPEEVDRRVEAEIKAQAEMDAQCSGCGDGPWSYTGITFNQLLYDGVSGPSCGSWSLLGGIYQHDFDFNNLNIPVILGGECWTNHRQQSKTYSWKSWSTWTATAVNESGTPCSFVVTLNKKSRQHTAQYQEKQWVNITFESSVFSKLSYDAEDPVYSNIQNPFAETMFEDETDPNLFMVYHRDEIPMSEEEIIDCYATDIDWPSDLLWSSPNRATVLLDGEIPIYQRSYPKPINPSRYQYGCTMYPSWMYAKITSVITDWMTLIPESIETTEMTQQGDFPDDIEQKTKTSLFNNFKVKRDEIWNDSIDASYIASDGRFFTTSAKVLHYLVMSYLDKIYDMLKSLCLGDNMVAESITQGLEQASGGTMTYDQLKQDTQNARELLSRLSPSFPLGFILDLKRVTAVPYGSWTEKFQCAVVQQPSFFANASFVDYYAGSGSGETKCTLRYQNINIFSPGAGIDSLIDSGFDAVNKQVCNALDTGFDKLDEIALEAGEEARQEVEDSLNTITEQIYTDLLANLSDRLTEELEQSATLQHLNVDIDALDLDTIVQTVLYNSRYPGGIENNSRFAHDLNTTELVIDLMDKLQETVDDLVDDLYGEYTDEMKQSIMDVLDSQVFSVYETVVSETISSSKELLKEEYGKLSSKFETYVSDRFSKLLSSFIPAGLPILPYIGWVCTLNVWYIDVYGEIPFFQVVDTYDETRAHPLWGHTAQEYTRQYKTILLDIDGDSIPESVIGNNIPVDFDYKTATFCVVPPNKLTGMGDRIGGFEETEHYP